MCDCEKVKKSEEIKIIINNIAFNPQTPIPNYAYEAMSLINKNQGIILPEIVYTNDNQGIANQPFVYDFKSEVRGLDVSVSANGIFPYRITDATDLDEHSNFWILSLNRYESPPYNNEQSNFRSLIKAHYSKNTNQISFLTKYNIPGPNTPNFESLVQISKDMFLLFSDGFSVFNGQGIVLIKIQDNEIKGTEIKLSIDGKILTPEQYDNLQISTAFNAKDGIIFVPQLPGELTGDVYHVSNRELKKLMDGEKTTMKAKPFKIIIEFEKKLLGVKYEGIEAMTMSHGNIYGLTEWSTVSLNGITFSKPFVGKLFV